MRGLPHRARGSGLRRRGVQRRGARLRSQAPDGNRSDPGDSCGAGRPLFCVSNADARGSGQSTGLVSAIFLTAIEAPSEAMRIRRTGVRIVSAPQPRRRPEA